MPEELTDLDALLLGDGVGTTSSKAAPLPLASKAAHHRSVEAKVAVILPKKLSGVPSQAPPAPSKRPRNE